MDAYFSATGDTSELEEQIELLREFLEKSDFAVTTCNGFYIRNNIPGCYNGAWNG